MSIETKINSLIAAANTKTGKTDADLTSAVQSLVDGYGAQAPKYVNSTAEMTDTGRTYVLAATGHVWAYGEVETETTITDTIAPTDGNPYHDGYRLGADATTDSMTSGATGYFLTPLIDLTKAAYQGKTIQLRLEGAHFAANSTFETWIQCRLYGLDKTVLSARPYVFADASNANNVVYVCNGKLSVEYNSDNHY